MLGPSGMFLLTEHPYFVKIQTMGIWPDGFVDWFVNNNPVAPGDRQAREIDRGRNHLIELLET